MGKASKWMINFLLLGKKKEILSYQEKPAPPPLKKRWSFGKIKRSNDSIDVSSFSTSFSVDYSITSTGGTTAKFPVGPGRRRAARDAAATRIQAAFRSYLARKALHALRALVKLQALVRGHQVRKRMESTLRSMHALMSIQVRARIQRIQMVEETQSQIGLKSQSSRYSGSSIEQETRKITPREANEVNSNEKSTTFRNKNRENERTGPRLKTYQSGDLSFLRREHQLEECLATARSSPLYSLVGTQAASGRASLFNNQRQEYPNYMVNTESSKAKVRSQSVPKQRPRWSIKGNGKSKGTSFDEMNDFQSELSNAGSGKLTIESQDPWFVKLY